ncbi:GNAT family N-acetyltransferase [Pseudomonas syringae group sp. J309-1]|uniref:GNAT family N-acetyltransferase n=1 Tax=Pseudomonas syringae group sp. J309-1 TaxID=3079588 RepID=UPI000F04E20F|nr:GNAT family N-acetyltransferase [Pseudomonas syringae group sp. J309-1]MDU8357349.1 GNAT family N-acetyltransferase [Pseudomonas syringae group sp. J309-1]
MQRTTERLLLRPPRPYDLAAMFAIYSDPATNVFNPNGPMKELAQAQIFLNAWMRHWQEQGYGWWAVATREAPDEIIGFGGVALMKYLDVERVNLGYRFGVPAWGKGYATELASATLDYAFNEQKLTKVYGLVRPTHQASIRVLEKIGMNRVDVLDDVPGQAPSLVFLANRS